MGQPVQPGPQTSEETARLIRRWHWRRWLIALVIGGVLLVAAGTTHWLRDGLERPLIVNDPLQRVDVIIVLGAGTRKHGDRLPPQAKQRTIEGIKLQQAGLAPRIIISGGRSWNTGFVEADEMVDFAMTQGLPTAGIIKERQSRNTYENAKFSLALMKQFNWQTAIVVTSPYHTWRSCRIFRAQHANVLCTPAPFSLFVVNSWYEHFTDMRSVIREYGAILYDWAKGEL